MGLADSWTRARASWDPLVFARRFYEPYLKDLRLTTEDVEEKDLDELYNSLQVVDNAIEHNPYPALRLKATGEGGLVIAKDDSDANFTVTMLPLLLEAKSQILDRIRVLTPKEKIASLSDLVDKVSDEEVRVALQQEIQDLEAQAQSLNDQAEQAKEAAVEEKSRQEAELDREIERFKERSKVYRSFLERESVATIVGALLLLILGAAHIVGMFTGTAATDILNNSFLVILGYFFGQTVIRQKQPE